MLILVENKIWLDLKGATLYAQDFKTNDVICKIEIPPKDYEEIFEIPTEFTQLCLPPIYGEHLTLEEIQEGLELKQFLGDEFLQIKTKLELKLIKRLNDFDKEQKKDKLDIEQLKQQKVDKIKESE